MALVRAEIFNSSMNTPRLAIVLPQSIKVAGKYPRPRVDQGLAASPEINSFIPCPILIFMVHGRDKT